MTNDLKQAKLRILKLLVMAYEVSLEFEDLLESETFPEMETLLGSGSFLELADREHADSSMK